MPTKHKSEVRSQKEEVAFTSSYRISPPIELGLSEHSGRLHLAAAALSGLLANPASGSLPVNDLVETAWTLADRMIARDPKGGRR